MIFKNKKIISALLISVFLLVGVFGFFSNITNAQATCGANQILYGGGCYTQEELRAMYDRGEIRGNFSSFTGFMGTLVSTPTLMMLDALGVTSGVATEEAKAATKKAINEVSGTESSIAHVIAWILFYIATFFSWLVALIVGAMVYVASYNDILGNKIVINGWAIVRDVANNFFIIILLVIAVGTILRVPNYNRQLLPKLLVMAVLINFSKTFTGIMIDFSQIITLWFASAINEQGGWHGGIILVALGLDGLYKLSSTGGLNNVGWTQDIPGLETTDAIRTLLFALILSVIAAVVVAIITIILVYRIVMLWFLVILSPLAFLLTTFPKGQQYAGMWWSDLSKNLVVGPVMLFFLYLSIFSGVSIDVRNPSGLDAAADASQSRNLGLGLNDFTNDPVKLIDFLIIIGLMVGSLYAAQKTSAAGSQWAGKGIAGLQKWGKRAAVGTAGLVGAGALQAGVAIPGARRVPILGRMAGQAVDQRKIRLATKKFKAEQERITSRAQALKVDGKDEKELRLIATTGDKYARIAATQAMMKQGMFRDDDTANRSQNIKLINDTKKMLPPELAATFMDNTKKYNPGLAHDTVYKDENGKFRTDAFVSDVRTGKIKAHEMMGSLSETQLLDLSKSLAPKGAAVKGDELAKFLAEHTKQKDENEMYIDLTDKQRTAIYGKVDHDTFERDSSGKLTDSGQKMRDKFNKATNFNHIMKTFDNTNTDDVDSIRTFVESNGNDIGKKMQDITDDFVQSFGDLIKPSQFKDQAPAIRKKLTDSFESVINKIAETDINTANQGQYQKMFKNALMSGASFNEANIAERDSTGSLANLKKRAILEDVMTAASVNDVENMRGLRNSSSQMELAGANMNINVIKGLSVSAEGGVLAGDIAAEVRRQAVGKASTTREGKRADQLKDI